MKDLCSFFFEVFQDYFIFKIFCSNAVLLYIQTDEICWNVKEYNFRAKTNEFTVYTPGIYWIQNFINLIYV